MNSRQALIINIGAPRTGTTTIQLHLLQRAKRYNVLTKTPYTSDNFLAKNSTASFTPRTIINFISALSDTTDISTRNDLSAAIRLLSMGSTSINIETREICSQLLKNLFEKIITISDKPFFIHDERLSDCAASLMGNSRHEEDFEFAINGTISAITNAQLIPIVVTCLREPISYLKSKYIRTFFQRQGKRLRKISPTEYIQKQSILENNHPGTSALTPAMHSEFIKQLQKHAFVKAFGFQELLASEDVFSLMGIQGEDKYAFRDFPRENKLPFSKEQVIEVEITEALQQYGFFDRIMKAQMFE